MMSKLDATAIQLANKVAAGDPKAVHTLLYWMTRTAEAEAGIDPGSARPDENDAKIMAKLLRRLGQTNGRPAGSETE